MDVELSKFLASSSPVVLCDERRLMSTTRKTGLIILLLSSEVANGDIMATRGPLPEPPLLAPIEIIKGNVEAGSPDVVAKIVIPRSLISEYSDSSQTQRQTTASGGSRAALVGMILMLTAISLLFAGRNNASRRKGVMFVTACMLFVSALMVADFLFPSGLGSPPRESNSPQLVVFEIKEHGHKIDLILSEQKSTQD